MSYDEFLRRVEERTAIREPAEAERTAVVVRMTRDEFAERVADELDVPVEEARRRVRAVFGTIREAVSSGEFRDVLEQLDPEYADLLP